jgi:hypothetical protein
MTQQLNDKVLTVVGAYETHKGTDEQYETISVQQLMDIERTNVPKDQARWVLCSTYNEPDGRKHKAQEERGEFVMVAIDLDTGNVQGKALVAAVQSFTGPVQMRAYASSSATKESRKWRVLIPTLTPMRHDEWLAVTVALNQHIERELGVRPDRALERAGQPIYLPNTAPRNDGVEPLTSDTLIKGVLMDWREAPGADHVLTFMAEEEERQREHQQRATEARRKMSQARARPDSEKSVIEQFNTANDLEQVMAACGYKPGPRGGWRSPRQSSGSYATKVFDEPAGQYWVSLSLSDLEAGVGSQTSDGRTCFGDAFDLYAFHMHANDRKAAIKAAANDLGIKPAPSLADQLSSMVQRKNTAKALQTLAQYAPTDVEFPEETSPQVKEEATKVIQKAAESAAPKKPDDGAPLLSFVRASQMPDWEPPQELVEGMLIENRMSVVYGDSNTGKSFLALDMAAHMTLGRDWFSRRVRQGAVLYLAAEAPRSIQDRARALEQKLGAPLDDLFITDCPIDIWDPNGSTTAIISTVAMIESTYGVKIRLIIVDTLARAMGGGDENATKDMGVLVKHSDLIRDSSQAHVMFIHHTGKDTARGARGSSALRAATDTEIEVSDPGNQKPKEFKVTKQRDLQGKGEVYGFILVTVNLGIGVFDNLMTTCYVQEAQPEQPDPMAGLKDGEIEILDAIRAQPYGGMRYGDLVNAIEGVAKVTVKRYIRNLRAKRLIYEQSGQYRLGSGQNGSNFGISGSEF